MVDRSLLEQAGLAADYDFWRRVIPWSGGIAAVVVAACSLAGLVATFKIGAINDRVATFGKQVDADTMKKPVSAWPTRLLVEHGWESHSIDTTTIALVKRPNTPSDVAQPTDLIVRRDDENLAWARALPVGQRYVWPWDGASTDLEDGKNTVALTTLVPTLGLGDFVRDTGNSAVDIVGVGLESSSGGDPKDEKRYLSITRGTRLITAVKQTLEVTDPNKTLNFRVLGLGRALKQESKESDPERRQRSALIIAVALFRHDIANLADGSLVGVLARVDLTDIDLKNYEYSYAISERLTNPLVFGGGGTPLQAPAITVEQALARRPSPADK